jgi:uncharacterized protein (DUF952 family)
VAIEGEGSGSPGDGPHSSLDHPPWSNVAYHLAPCSLWEAAHAAGRLVPERFAEEGFVHLTLGLDQLLVPANAYYRDDPRPHVALTVDLDALDCEVRFDAEPHLYPHAYGPLPVTAVVEERPAHRAPDGTFLAWGEARPVRSP